MAFPITLGELVTQCQQHANKPAADDSQIATPEWKSLISMRYGRMHGVVADTGARCFETEVTLNLSNLALPSDHRSTIGVDRVLDSAGRRIELPELMLKERNLLRSFIGDARAWSFTGVSLQLYPLPTSGTYKHLYVPQPTSLATAADSTSVDLLTSDGLEAVLWGVASVALHRGESDQQRALGEAEAALKRLKEWAIVRSQTMPKRRQISGLANNNYSDVNGLWNPASWRFGR